MVENADGDVVEVIDVVEIVENAEGEIVEIDEVVEVIEPGADSGAEEVPAAVAAETEEEPEAKA